MQKLLTNPLVALITLSIAVTRRLAFFRRIKSFVLMQERMFPASSLASHRPTHKVVPANKASLRLVAAHAHNGNVALGLSFLAGSARKSLGKPSGFLAETMSARLFSPLALAFRKMEAASFALASVSAPSSKSGRFRQAALPPLCGYASRPPREILLPQP